MPNSVEVGGIAADRIRSIVERIERLEEERKVLGEDIKDIYTESKSAGFNPKVIKQIIAIRKKDSDEVSEQEMLLELYKRALGMQPDLPFAEPVEGNVVAMAGRA